MSSKHREEHFQNLLWIELSALGFTLHRNHSGLGVPEHALRKAAGGYTVADILRDIRKLPRITFGLGKSTGDLVGWGECELSRPVRILVGREWKPAGAPPQRVAIWCEIEVKGKKTPTDPDQLKRIALVNDSGGFGLIVRSDEEDPGKEHAAVKAREVLDEWERRFGSLLPPSATQSKDGTSSRSGG